MFHTHTHTHMHGHMHAWSKHIHTHTHTHTIFSISSKCMWYASSFESPKTTSLSEVRYRFDTFMASNSKPKNFFFFKPSVSVVYKRSQSRRPQSQKAFHPRVSVKHCCRTVVGQNLFETTDWSVFFPLVFDNMIGFLLLFQISHPCTVRTHICNS